MATIIEIRELKALITTPELRGSITAYSGIPTPTPTDPITFTVTANGNATTATTALTFTFSSAPTSLTAAQINVSSGTKGALTGSGTTRTLAFTPAAAGNVTVSIANSEITTGTKSVNVYSPVSPATFTVTANGNATTATTTLTFTFNRAPTGLTAAQINVSSGTKGALSGSGTTRTLAFTPTTAGNITVSINNSDVESGNKTVNVYMPASPATFTVSANGSSTTATTALTLTFNRAPTGLTAAQITVTNGTKGTLSGSGTTRTLGFTPTATGTATVTIANSDVETGTRNVQVYLPVGPTVPFSYQGWSTEPTAAQTSVATVQGSSPIAEDTGSGDLSFVQEDGIAFYFFATRRGPITRFWTYMEAFLQEYEWYPEEGRMNTDQKVIDGYTYTVYQFTIASQGSKYTMHADFS